MKDPHCLPMHKSASRFLLILLSVPLCFLLPKRSLADVEKPTDTLNINLINDLVLKGEVNKVLRMLDSMPLTRQADKDYKLLFEQRFKYQVDQTDFLKEVPLTLQPIFLVYQAYWRMCLLDNSKIDDAKFRHTLTGFFLKENSKQHFTSLVIDEANLEIIQKTYITQKGYFANDFGRTGFLYELLLWKEVDPKHYTVSLIDDTVSVKVNFIQRFISLGWLGYARLGRGPGGWATNEELFCVGDLYRDRSAESFTVSYLKHEGQHFHDYKAFPNLPGKDLEYRGKILELYYSKDQLFDLIFSFIEGGKNDITNAHPFANYCIIRDMSHILFDNDHQTDMAKWKEVGIERIHIAAKQLYHSNTQRLKDGLMLK